MRPKVLRLDATGGDGISCTSIFVSVACAYAAGAAFVGRRGGFYDGDGSFFPSAAISRGAVAREEPLRDCSSSHI